MEENTASQSCCPKLPFEEQIALNTVRIIIGEGKSKNIQLDT